MSEHSLTRALRELIASRRIAALGTRDTEGEVFVSMVPYVIDTQASDILLLVSSLASHTGNMQRHPQVSLLVCAAEPADDEPVHALARVTLDMLAREVPAQSSEAQACREIYLTRFPDAEMLLSLADFRFFRLSPQGARQVAGFGAARSLPAEEIRRALAPAAQ